MSPTVRYAPRCWEPWTREEDVELLVLPTGRVGGGMRIFASRWGRTVGAANKRRAWLRRSQRMAQQAPVEERK